MNTPIRQKTERFTLLFSLVLGLCLANFRSAAQSLNNPDVLTILADLENPLIGNGDPAPGKPVFQYLETYTGTEVAHTLYLPTDWTPGGKYPVIVEYLGNGSRVMDNKGIGYGLSGGKGFIWIVLPFVSTDHKKDMDWWWGDVEATVAYAKEAVPLICHKWGGDKTRIILTGYSRGAIACNYIGLHDSEIAKMWKAIIAVSHYDDGHTLWGMTPEEQGRAAERLLRLGNTPQFICGEHCGVPHQGSDKPLLNTIKGKNISIFDEAKKELGLIPITEAEGTRKFIYAHHPSGNYTIVDLPWVNHGSQVLLRDTPQRQQIRQWIQTVLRN
ncbi:MAG: hypothetical protein GZ094_01685 [Mariniphaga sp.]|nr:hypothetical protein [Mariniphaga sp.]